MTDDYDFDAKIYRPSIAGRSKGPRNSQECLSSTKNLSYVHIYIYVRYLNVIANRGIPVKMRDNDGEGEKNGGELILIGESAIKNSGERGGRGRM